MTLDSLSSVIAAMLEHHVRNIDLLGGDVMSLAVETDVTVVGPPAPFPYAADHGAHERPQNRPLQ